MSPTTVEEEIISISELELGGYIKVLDEMLEPCFPKRSLFTTFDDVYETFCSLLESIEDYNILYGTLIRMEVFKNMPADDCSEEYYLKAKKNIIYGLSELTDINYTVNDILKNLSLGKEIDMTYTYTKYNQADCIHYFYMGKEFREELYFDSLQSYFSFLIMKFLSSKHKVVRCGCCGKFFFPKPRGRHFTAIGLQRTDEPANRLVLRKSIWILQRKMRLLRLLTEIKRRCISGARGRGIRFMKRRRD